MKPAPSASSAVRRNLGIPKACKTPLPSIRIREKAMLIENIRVSKPVSALWIRMS